MENIWILFFLVCNSGTHLASAVYVRSSENVTTVHNDTKACGVPAITPQEPGCPREGLGIINGEEAVAHSWPWQVSLQNNSGHYCGGSLIDESWVVTAAHCDVSASDHVILGQHNLKSNNDIQSKTIGKVFNHPEYLRTTLDYDIALIKLECPAQMSDHVSAVCVADTGDHIHARKMCVVTGWGRTRYHPVQRPDKLQQACLPTLSHSQCEMWFRRQITSHMFCAGASEADTCNGDSGGPLVCKKHGAWTLYGITSWGQKGCPPNTPGVYTKVTNLRPWMDRIMADN